MKKLKNQMGFTLLEAILVVAILGILGGVSTVGVYNYQRSLGQLERDGIAREIFVAAQNHLTIAYGAGYYGAEDEDFGTAEDAAKSVYYFAVNDNYFTKHNTIDETSVLGQMLPFASIDETVRLGGSYIIRYQKDTGLVLDVFYCSRSGTPERYNHNLSIGEYNEVLALRGTENKLARRNWHEHILGWYGGTGAIELPPLKLEPPTVSVRNEEKLYVVVSDLNAGNGDAKLKLIVTGAKSGAQKAYDLTIETDRVKPLFPDQYLVILDDVTASGMHFADITADSGKFIPGEDVVIQAVSYSTTKLANIAYSSKYTANSLFGGISSDHTTAYIGNIRHLENLDKTISGLDTDGIGIHAAEQTDSFSWDGFQKGIRTIEAKYTGSVAAYEQVSVVKTVADPGEGTGEGTGCYMPIAPKYELTYDGKHHSISGVKAERHNAGLFGSVEYGTVKAIRNLELLDFQITGKAAADVSGAPTGATTAGALAGSLTGCAVTNVLARNSAASTEATITAAIAGGLIGVTGDYMTVQYSAAVQTVQGSTFAGGLIGTASGKIVGCYAGGHTKTGSYEEWLKTKTHDVSGGTAGGLVGSATATISDSYSTCSVYGTSMAGGFAGSAGGSIENCYATGLVDGADSAVKFAFVAERRTLTLSGNYYYMAINEIPKEGGKDDETEPMLPVSGYSFSAANLAEIKPLDLNADAYNEFTGAFAAWNPARAYDSALVKYYGGKYPLRTVKELGAALPSDYSNWNELYVATHYGDWPSPEVFFLNT